MDDHFYNNEFEKFLQQQVKQHRMYPSDAVWKGIYKQVHGDKKWPGLYFIAILIVAALTVCTLFMESTPVVSSQQLVAKAMVPGFDHLDPAQVTHETLKKISYNRQQQPVSTLTDPLAVTDENVALPAENNNTILIKDIGADADLIAYEAELAKQQVSIEQASAIEPDRSTIPTVSREKTAMKGLHTIVTADAQQIDQPAAPSPEIKQVAAKQNKWQYEFYITPSSDYRNIVDEKAANGQFSGPLLSNNGVTANKVIRYKPGMGIELGLGVLYSLTDRLRLKTSIQYNVRQYNIEAYAGSHEMSKIALVRGGSVDSVSVVSRYRTTSGNSEALLLNKYHQVSLPVGLEYGLVSSDKFGINLAASVQPTYTFSQSSYLLTADYKSYADGTSMLRRWNVNSSMEATFSYKVGDFQWKFGPQVRYQHLPTYTDAYPIKEYLIDYGFKIGFTKTIK